MTVRNGDDRIARSQLVDLLSPTLGQEKSEEVVAAASRKLGYGLPDDYGAKQASSVLASLSHADGIVGVVARFAFARADMLGMALSPPAGHDAPASSAPQPRDPRASGPLAGASPPSPTRVSLSELLGFLAPALGDEKAKEAVVSHAATLGVRGNDFSRDEALSTLEAMARADGILGVVARFSKARFILRFPS